MHWPAEESPTEMLTSDISQVKKGTRSQVPLTCITDLVVSRRPIFTSEESPQFSMKWQTHLEGLGADGRPDLNDEGTINTRKTLPGQPGSVTNPPLSSVVSSESAVLALWAADGHNSGQRTSTITSQTNSCGKTSSAR